MYFYAHSKGLKQACTFTKQTKVSAVKIAVPLSEQEEEQSRVQKKAYNMFSWIIQLKI